MLREYAQAYVDQVRTDFRALTPPPETLTDAAAWYAEAARLAAVEHELGWSDLFLLERFNLRLLSDDDICARTEATRARYRAALGTEVKPDSSAAPKVEPTMALRAELEHALAETQWIFRKGVERQLNGKWARQGIAVRGALMCLILALAILLASSHGNPTLAATLAMLFGTLGGMASVMRRLQQGEVAALSQADSYRVLTQIRASRGSIYSGLYLAPVFALVAFLFFNAGLATSELFPYAKPAGGGATLCLSDVDASLAKLLIWSFLAGFSERFIPDILDKLAGRKP